MSEQGLPGPRPTSATAPCWTRKVMKPCIRRRCRIGRLLGEQGKILDWMTPYTRVKNTSHDPGHVSIKWYEDGLLNVSANCLDRHLSERGDKVAIIWEGTTRLKIARSPIANCTPKCASLPTCSKPRGQAWRHGLPLYAHGAGGGHRHAGLYPHRGRAQHRLRRLLAGSSRAASSTPAPPSSSPPMRGCGRSPHPLKKNVDEASPADTKVSKVIVLKRTGGNVAWHEHRTSGGMMRSTPPAQIVRPKPWAPKIPPVRALHLRLHRQAQGVLHHGRLSGLCRPHLQIRVRLPRRGHLLVYRRRGLGHRSLLSGLRAAGQRRHHRHVRRGAQLPGHQPHGGWWTNIRSPSSIPPHRHFAH